MMAKRRAAAALAALAALAGAGPLAAQEVGGGTPLLQAGGGLVDPAAEAMPLGGGTAEEALDPAPEETVDAATAAYIEALDHLQEALAIPYVGKADADYARFLIPLRQAAIDLAQVVIAQGADPEIKGSAEALLAAETKEIAFLREWLSKHPL